MISDFSPITSKVCNSMWTIILLCWLHCS